MSLMPKRVKHRKVHRGKIRGVASRGNTVAFGDFGLQAMEPAWITARQIEAARVAITRNLATGGKYWIRIFPHKSMTAKPLEVRMGSGKGEPDHWVATVKPGTVLFEVGGVDDDNARLVFNRAAHKLPIKVRMAHRRPSI